MQEKTLKEVVEFARRFMNERYAPVMFQPSRLNGAEINTYYQDLANLIGLPLDSIRRYGSRIDEMTYVTEFMASERKNIGAMDSRYSGDISTINRELYEDPSYRDLAPAFYPSYMNYLQTDLNLRIRSAAYEDFSIEALHSWDWGTYDSPGLPNFLQRLRRTIISNPTMNIFIGSGYYDLRTPFSAMEYSIDHLDLPSNYRKNFQIEYYEAGHGFIFDRDCLRKFNRDVKRFYGRNHYETDSLARNSSPEDD
jgi:carboxypeptidase C (cathepsin A)